MNSLVLQIIAGILSLWLAIKYVPGVEFSGEIRYLLLAGVLLGAINFYLKPILKLITLPLRILTFGLFGLLINMLLVWIVDFIFSASIIPQAELTIYGIKSLFFTTLIIWGVSTVLMLFFPRKRKTN